MNTTQHVCPHCEALNDATAYECDSCGWEFGFSTHSEDTMNKIEGIRERVKRYTALKVDAVEGGGGLCPDEFKEYLDLELDGVDIADAVTLLAEIDRLNAIADAARTVRENTERGTTWIEFRRDDDAQAWNDLEQALGEGK